MNSLRLAKSWLKRRRKGDLFHPLRHVIVLNEEHLQGILQEYVRYYNTQRTHLGIGKDSPETRKVQTEGEIGKVPVVGGLHHLYYRRAA